MQVVGGWGSRSPAGCLRQATSSDEVAIADESITLASGTTPADSGLLRSLHPGFEEGFGTNIDTVLRGTGGALRTARDGDCDLVVVHARPLEDAFLRDGHGINRRTLMVNDFLVVGPPDNPAGVGSQDPVQAVTTIATSEATFLSRGDRSGTHFRERQLWTEAGIDPSGEWYRETGQGMGQTLTVAAEANGYTLTDRGSFLNVATEGALVAHTDQGIDDPPPLLRNEYAVIPTNPARHEVNYPLAMAYVGYVTGPGQDRIEEFRIDGSRAYRPTGLNQQPDFQQYVPAAWRE